MGYVPDVEGITVMVPVDGTAVLDRRSVRKMLRFGGLAMDPLTGSTSWRGRLLPLDADERRLLGALLRRGGQILSLERLAASIGTTSDIVEQRVIALGDMLQRAGVTCLPRRARGLGYVLWRG
ncbi:MAG: hypothetical protein ACHQ4H_02460 [Ktedonobacterales bacterium]